MQRKDPFSACSGNVRLEREGRGFTRMGGAVGEGHRRSTHQIALVSLPSVQMVPWEYIQRAAASVALASGCPITKSSEQHSQLV